MSLKGGRPVSGESPLLMFVSSVMDQDLEDLQWARDEVVSIVGDTPFLTPWLFEYTPASSEALSDGYLRKVRDADFLVWLVGENTTAPVRREIREALENQVRILTFKLPVEKRTSDTLDLLRRVGTSARYASVRSRESLGSEIEVAINDELVRAVRQQPRSDPVDVWIEEQARRSRLRCIQGWVAAGVPYSEAAALADDPSVAPSFTRYFREDERVRIIFGPLGAGKSLAVNRLLQSAITSYRTSPQKPIPIYISGRELADCSLERALLDQLPAAELIQGQGVCAVIDDITHLRIRRSLELLAEAETLLDQSPGSVFTFACRELLDLSDQWPNTWISPLPEITAIDLVNRLSGGSYTEIDLRHRWPQSVRSSIQTPLFTILLGVFLRSTAGRPPRSTVEMIPAIADRALSRFGEDEASLRALLGRLAMLCVNQQGNMVAGNDVGDRTAIRRLVATGLVHTEGSSIGFTLQLMLHWYAALALKQGTPTAGEIVQDREVLDAWYEPLLLLVRTGDYSTASEYLGHIARRDPGYAASVVHEAIDKWPDDDLPSPLPSDRECERRIHSCMDAWVNGVGELATWIAPVNERGEVMPIRVKTNQGALSFAWYRGKYTASEVPDLPKRIFTTSKDAMSWRGATFTHAPSQPTWPWRVTLESLSMNLGQLLKAHEFLPESGVGLHEAVWNCALAILNRGSLHRDPIPIARLRIPDGVPNEAFMPGKLRGLRARHFRSVLGSLTDEGYSELPPPWPTADLTLARRSGPILSTYSSDRLRHRLEVVFSGALETYRQLVDMWFSPFAERLGVYALMPVEVKGVLQHDPTDSQDKSVLFWYMLPLADGESNSVGIDQGDPRAAGAGRDLLDRLHAVTGETRPRRGRFASVSTHTAAASLFIHSYPVIDVAYGWLWENLAKLKWIDGMRSRLY